MVCTVSLMITRSPEFTGHWYKMRIHVYIYSAAYIEKFEYKSTFHMHECDRDTCTQGRIASEFKRHCDEYRRRTITQVNIHGMNPERQSQEQAHSSSRNPLTP